MHGYPLGLLTVLPKDYVQRSGERDEGGITFDGSGLKILSDPTLDYRLKEFLESHGRPCSFESGFITPEYVYGIWGGEVSKILPLRWK